MNYSAPSIDRDDFDRSGWEDVIASSPEPTCDRYADLFARKLVRTDDPPDEKTATVFRLLAAVTSLQLREDPEGEPFGPPAFAYYGQSWTIDDFSDPHLDLFAQVALDIGDAELRARLAEVRGSSPIGSTLFFRRFAGETQLLKEMRYRHRASLTTV